MNHPQVDWEDVLNDVMLNESDPSHRALARWSKRYPQYKKDLADYFAAWALQEAAAAAGRPQPKIDEEKIVRQSVEYAMDILRRQGRIRDIQIEPLAAFDQLVLTAVAELHGNAYSLTITESVSRMLGKDVVLGSTMAALRRLEERGLVSSLYVEETQPEGDPRTYYTINLAGERALAAATETAKAVADLLGEMA